ncbi:unnamed protein product [Caretta caretta]
MAFHHHVGWLFTTTGLAWPQTNRSQNIWKYQGAAQKICQTCAVVSSDTTSKLSRERRTFPLYLSDDIRREPTALVHFQMGPGIYKFKSHIVCRKSAFWGTSAQGLAISKVKENVIPPPNNPYW